MKKIIESPKEFLNMNGEILGVSPWKLVTQKEINKFARVTGDFQWIHVNENKAKNESPFKTTIAHGYYSLSLIPKFLLIFTSKPSSSALILPSFIASFT